MVRDLAGDHVPDIDANGIMQVVLLQLNFGDFRTFPEPFLRKVYIKKNNKYLYQ
jgi:hypothetical protein